MSNGQRLHVPTPIRRASIWGGALLAASMMLAPAPGSAEPATAPLSPFQKPTIHEVKAKIDTLNHEAEIAAEQMNTVTVQLQDARQVTRSLGADLDRRRDEVEALRSQVIGTSLADYQSSASLSTTTAFLVADDPEDFLTDLANSAVAESQQADLLTQLTEQQRQLASSEQQAAGQFEAVRVDKAELAEHRSELDAKVQQAQDILNDLEAAERQRLRALQQAEAAVHPGDDPSREDPSRDAPRVATTDTAEPASDVATSDRAAVAVSTALAQVGDAYVYGAVGPDAFDCSGLTMYAWAAAGVSIPHSSGLQTGVGTPVSISALMPGDLVFYYSPISHVGMYIGNGQIVHAANPSAPVEVVPLNLMPIAMAVRIG